MLSTMFKRASAAPRTGISRRALAGLSSIILFFIISGTFTFLNVRTLRDDAVRIQHSHKVLLTLSMLLSAVQDTETGQRGFLLTGKDSYLTPFRDAQTQVQEQLKRLTTLTQDNALQQARIEPLARHVDAKLNELNDTIALRRRAGLAAALEVVTSDRGKAEMDAIRAQINTLQEEETKLRIERIEEMDSAYRTAWGTVIISALVGVILAIFVGLLLRRASIIRAQREWLQTGKAQLSQALLGNQGTDELSDNILRFLSRFLGATSGALFEGDGVRFKRAATVGIPADAAIPQGFSAKEGLLGGVVVTQETAILSDIPDGYLTFGSALGRDKPSHIAIAPATGEETVFGVIELGFMMPIGDDVVAFLAEASPTIGLALRSARLRTEMHNLLEETQHQAEELQVQSEELRVSNDQLEEQARALQESQVRLEQQQVELEQTNSQLETQAQVLEAQRDDLARANASVEAKAAELEQASQYKSDFLANMSHELRTPLNSMLILSRLLGDNPDGNLTDQQVEYAQTIRSSGNDLLDLINDILDLSKIEAGHVRIQTEVVTLSRVVTDMERLFAPLASDRRLAFHVSVDEACPAELETDRQRLDQVLKNLLSNAFKFTEEGNVDFSVECTADGLVRFSVSDSGIGISPEQQRDIFEPFRQADGSISRKFGGTGLGLSISRELARLLGGEIGLHSTPGKGSCFTLTLPVNYDASLVKPREAPRPSTASPEQPVPQKNAGAPRPPSLIRRLPDDREKLCESNRILLVVEDDQHFAKIVCDISRELGFDCIIAHTAEEAMALAEEYRPHAIVLDIGLPDQSGLAVLDRLKSDVDMRHIPVHVVSGSDHAQVALSLGAIGYVVKPVDREELAEVLDALSTRLTKKARQVLIVEDDPVQREALAQLLATNDVETVGVGTVSECLDMLGQRTFDCMVLDLSLPDASGYSLLETLSKGDRYGFPPVIVYTGHDLSTEEEQRLRRYSSSIIIKGARSPERLLDEVSLFLHQVVTELPPEQQKMIRKAHNRDAVLEGRRILVVEDDVRNIYSLTSVLEPRGAHVEIARNGREALEALEKAKGTEGETIDLILMDVMMPVMDGLTATQKIRTMPGLEDIPIIMLTAKAMPDDQQRCIEAGASDYMAKPLDVDKLLSLVRIWMPR